MKDISNSQVHCPVEVTLKLIGGKHKVMILWNLVDQTLRFGELKRMIPLITSKMLTQQLRELEEDGLIIRKTYAEVPPRVEYSLTKTGYSLYPILNNMYEWGTSYLETKGIKPNCNMKESIRG